MSIVLGLVLTAAACRCGLLAREGHPVERGVLLPTGRRITPTGQQTGVGSLPNRLALSPDGRWIAVTTSGYREALSILSATSGRVVSRVAMDGTVPGTKRQRQGLYYGLAWGPAPGPSEARAIPFGAEPRNERRNPGEVGSAAGYRLYASRGAEGCAAVYPVDADGRLGAAAEAVPPVASRTSRIAGVALGPGGSPVYLARTEFADGPVGYLDVVAGAESGRVGVGGYPLAVAAVTRGASAGCKVYVSSERDGAVYAVDVRRSQHPAVARRLATGAHPVALLLDRAQRRLFVANAGSDTMSIVDTATDRVRRTVVLRPTAARGLPGATPTGLALSADEKRLYVTLADMNALAVLRLRGDDAVLAGYVPVGWYPTDVVAAPDGRHLFVANAKGAAARNPNAREVGRWGRYILAILQGTVERLQVPRDADLPALTRHVLADSLLARLARPQPALPVQGKIHHVIYVVKENRTYDQVLGDLARGNGDPSQVLFGSEVTPNQHALAERFAIMDNFYCCAEVSADGWNWSTSGMASSYVERTVPYFYSDRGGPYDFEGENGDRAVEREGVRDVATAPGGYLWDDCARHGVSYRTYGVFTVYAPGQAPLGGQLIRDNQPTKQALVGHSDPDYLRFDMDYADSDAWQQLGFQAPGQVLKYGAHAAPSRVAEWKREFEDYVRHHDLPALEFLRLPRDHTAGTRPNSASPTAMVADNDCAVGELVETVTRSPYWKDTLIVIIEDDAQSGYDHVDCHRSTCYLISPYVPRGTVDHRFYNTDSALRTIEALLGLPPMCQYDAIASTFACFGSSPRNLDPYLAVVPPKRILAEVNGPHAYRAGDCARLDFREEDRVPDAVLNDILWHAVKGPSAPAPPVRHGLRLAGADTDP